MTGLQEATYIMALVFMGVSLIIIFSMLAALLIIRKKITNLEKMIKDKVETVSSFPARVGEVIDTVQNLRKHNSK